MMGLDYSALAVKRVGDEFQLQQITCKSADKNKPETVSVLATLKPTSIDPKPYQPAIYKEIYLRMSVNDGKVKFAYSSDGKTYKNVGDEFTMREGLWIGAKIGFVTEETNIKGNSGYMDVDWFRITK